MQYGCYIEINIICLGLLGIFFYRIFQRRSMLSSADTTMARLFIAVAALCVADMIAIVSRGGTFPGARVLVEASNSLYILMMPVISMLWCDYSRQRIGHLISGTKLVLYRLPCMLFIIAALLNPLHHFFFSIDAANLYVRGPGVYVHWLVSWYYLIVAGIDAWKAYKTVPNRLQRMEYRSFLAFLIFPAIGCITQMLFYGITSVQVGITLSLVLVTFQALDQRVSVDELTGINNRAAMKNYVESLLHGNDRADLTVLMLDVNRFKQINDSYGHLMGDQALRDVASCLRTVCRHFSEPLFLCRYGGDEFLFICSDLDESTTHMITDDIHRTLSGHRVTVSSPYTLEVSVGHATGICQDMDDYKNLIRQADVNMYENKKQRR